LPVRRTITAVTLGLLVVVTAGCSAATTATSAPSAVTPVSAPAPAPVRQVDPAAFAAEIDGGRFAINVHIPNEGSLPGTDLPLPYNEIEQRSTELPADHDTPLAIYCMTGHMSAIAGQTLTGLGYTDIVELRGGMQAWQVVGQPFIPAGG
jgi:rhodanese-related sulfurtransferase